MKNLRLKNPEFKQLQALLKQPAQDWNQFSEAEKVELSLKFLALPEIKRQGSLSEQTKQFLAPSASDLYPQVNQLLSEMPLAFASIEDLLNQTAGLFLLSTGED
ncbi:hypothetical protein COW36_22810 [bacterium (Candidatus Blackallbacteria) CG17_big_fil_post_rev_8_21_14_2_50_48_46]|uniref:Uncharacterized protein n=1 Tax=bacterium (Candidatus Blackallbacteria) CG17_big_fil_post_rev_8_21_14_2_50_48_46 TaxID=2014261 RepID=A0A2M7FY22_9BACT|nr:MAG: hypothetical protein COW64_07580 [bacterium (Candidatus Blackallbacteria) CG18_big_fil_WC_8_21_14_2_50_49_26]PIW14211.1 MAG: hypothetical protein COW36_22810 [bacterium (Candidatus Blackallbacteria) CG17_big_fil_post_rev_8_21_14_2_50_48_46]PIW46752.1 MAG: hypothetical protein COW20_15085 [bacterium (Candidatus Blackallbacteria) CG13_big_fil_rev_8_21_14_2_50_49_14]